MDTWLMRTIALMEMKLKRMNMKMKNMYLKKRMDLNKKMKLNKIMELIPWECKVIHTDGIPLHSKLTQEILASDDNQRPMKRRDVGNGSPPCPFAKVYSNNEHMITSRY